MQQEQEQRQRQAHDGTLNEIFLRAACYNAGDAKRIQHLTKVHSFARSIALSEGIPPDELFTLEVASLLHDIGIKPAESQYGRCDGKLQETLGPPVARKLLEGLCLTGDTVDRVCFLIGHHHTYDTIDSADWRILVEADFLVNLFEDGASSEAIKAAYRTVFCTASGKALCRAMFALQE